MRRALKGVTIVVIRYGGGQLKNSKPCTDCCNMIRQLGIKNVCYSNDGDSLTIEKARHIRNDAVCGARRVYGHDLER